MHQGSPGPPLAEKMGLEQLPLLQPPQICLLVPPLPLRPRGSRLHGGSPVVLETNTAPAIRRGKDITDDEELHCPDAEFLLLLALGTIPKMDFRNVFSKN